MPPASSRRRTRREPEVTQTDSNSVAISSRRRTRREPEVTQADTNRVTTSNRRSARRQAEVTQTGSNSAATSSRRRTRSEPEVTQTDSNGVATDAPSRKRRKVKGDGQDDTLCFYDAAVRLKENTITEDEYLQAIVAHCTGLRHGENQLCNGDRSEVPEHWDADDAQNHWQILFASNVVGVDSFAAKITEFIAYYVTEDNPVHDTAPIFQVLKAFRADDVAAFRAGLDKMDETYFKRHEREVACPSLRWALCHYLATVAIHKKKVGVLKPILETSVDCEMAFDAEYDNLKQLPKTNREILRVIDESGFKSMVPPRKRFNRLPIWYYLP